LKIVSGFLVRPAMPAGLVENLKQHYAADSYEGGQLTE
jgi:hypothetical protein